MIDSLIYISIAFKFSCRNGHLHTAEWLYNLSNMDNNTKININETDDIAFRYTYQNGHINIAEWLYNLSIKNNMDGNTKINIHADDKYAFKWRG